MDAIAWEEGFSVGVAKLDEEHKRLIGVINLLLEAIASGKEAQALGPVFRELFEYTRHHFEHEEALLDLYGFPWAAEHKAEHLRLIRELEEIKSNALTSSSLLSLEMLDFLRDWLGIHILERDKGYASFLASKGLA
jgi:hemerythrin-like metal-binding protein